MDWRISKNNTAVFGLVFALLSLPLEHLSAAEYWLCADQTTLLMPDGVSVPVWGYALDDDNNALNGCGGPVSVPGPALSLAPGDTTLTIHLTNNLSSPTSLVIPGQVSTMTPVMFTDSTGRQRVRAFTQETAPASTLTYTWTGFKPGTYAYQSGSHPAVQVQMGLYGAVTRDAAAGTAYTGVGYDHALTLLYSELDPALHSAVASGAYGPGTAMTSTIDYRPKYFLVNGAPFSAPATPLAAGNAGQRTLIRFINMGLKSHAPVVQGLHMDVVAEEGHAYPYPRTQYSVLLPAGATRDAILSPALPGTHAVFDRRLDLTNAAQAPGGLLSFLQFGTVAGTPTALADSFSTAEDTVLVVAAAGVLTNDSDPDGDILSAVLANAVSSGSLTLNADGGFSFTPMVDFNGVAEFSYKASDGAHQSAPVQVAITVTPVNDAPVATNDAYTAVQGQTLSIAAPGVLGTDTDADGDTLSVALVSAPTNGTLTLGTDGAFQYTSTAAFTGVDSFTYTAGDGVLNSAAATVNITVGAAVNSSPTANDDYAEVLQNTGASNNFVVIDVLANDTDADGSLDPNRITVVTPPRYGTAVVNAGAVTYTPRAGYRGSDALRYTVRDNAGAESNPASVRISVLR